MFDTSISLLLPIDENRGFSLRLLSSLLLGADEFHVLENVLCIVDCDQTSQGPRNNDDRRSTRSLRLLTASRLIVNRGDVAERLWKRGFVIILDYHQFVTEKDERMLYLQSSSAIAFVLSFLNISNHESLNLILYNFFRIHKSTV